jgi:1,4-dihydroxy-2-naphthoate octaprenyltransferase
MEYEKNHSQIALWIAAFRPKTLPASISPVIVGTAMAILDKGLKPVVALAAMACALLLQVGSNLANDYFDYKKGVDDVDRLGPTRVTQSGLIPAQHVKGGMIVVFILAAMIGLYLIMIGGWPILLIGAASILTACIYSGGPYPLALHGLGEVAVFIFFGLIAVCGTYYLQTFQLTMQVVLASIPVGFLITAILVVNNLRDIDTDKQVGKNTLSVMIGERWTKIEFIALLAGAYVIPVVFFLFKMVPGWLILLPLASLPMALSLINDVNRKTGRILNLTLAKTAQLSFVFSLLFSVGLIVGEYLG